MSIYTQTCGVVLLAILLVLFLMKRSKIFLNTEKIFILTLISSLLANIIDIICQFLLADLSVSYSVSKFFCEVYQILILMTLCCTMLYVSRDIYGNNRQFVKNVWYYILILFVVAGAIFVLPEELSREPGKLYAYGLSVNVSYSVALFYIISVLVRVNVLKKKMNADRRRAINVWMCLWILVAVFEYIFPSIFMSGFATAIGVMIIYIKLENPGMNMDRQSGLYNQNAFMEYVKQLYESNKKFSLLIITSLNYGEELYGHMLDLKRLPQIINAKGAVVFRKTEDEIVLVFQKYEDIEKWEESIWDDKDPDILALRNALWISIENSQWFKDSEELMFFIKYAMMNALKKTDFKDKKIVAVSEDMINVMRGEKQVEKMLDEALDEKRVEVFYQPIFSTEKQRFTTAEALVRIRDRDGKIIPPGVFIPVAEKSGKIIALGNEVFRQVCRLIDEDKIEQYGIEYIEVNLSVAQCADVSLADNYIATMQVHRINPKNINLEITESASLQSKKILLDNMHRLIEYGVNFSLDDFGTGQSNLNYIVDMPVDIVKFDRDMISAYFDNHKAKYVMDAAMHMIHGMGLKIVSEGIETNEQFGKMRELGISYIQGFYFSKPLEKNEFIQYLIEHNARA